MLLKKHPEIRVNKTTEELRHKGTKQLRHRDCDFCRCEALRQSRGATGVLLVASSPYSKLDKS